ncbi:MAG: hypothetical protein NTU47_01220 [Ignavibacteriales bacterium]|nr:hypothetical protein [Ignavibacteriales bacterium]
MKKRTPIILSALLLFALNAHGQVNKPSRHTKVKLIYSSDIYFPPDDPDDYFDLATLFAMPEIEVAGVILDQQLYDRRPKSEGTGVVPLQQIFEISGRRAPHAIGLRAALRSIDDKGLDQPDSCQKGVEMILDLLRKTKGEAVLLTVGTERDIAAAFNRDPGLFRKKVSRIYLNAGIYGFPEGRIDVNLLKDRNAFIAIMKSGLPVHWAPCFGENNYETYWQADQGKVLASATWRVQNYFLYAFSKGTGKIGQAAGQVIADPLEFLKRPLDLEELGKVYRSSRNMWSTASILDAAGLKIYANKQGEYTASRRPAGKFTREVKPYSFCRIKVFIDDQGRVHPAKPGNLDVFVFHKNDPEQYRNSLESVLRQKFGGL